MFLWRTYWRLGRNCDENRENNFGQVLRQCGTVSGGSVFSADVDGMGDMRQCGSGGHLPARASHRDFYGGVCGGVFLGRLGLTRGWQGRKSDAAISGWRCFCGCIWLCAAQPGCENFGLKRPKRRGTSGGNYSGGKSAQGQLEREPGQELRQFERNWSEGRNGELGAGFRLPVRNRAGFL